MAISVGIDLVEIERIKKLLGKYPERFLKKHFTETELDYCKDKARPEIHVAARFAAKEALSKALGTGLAQGIKLKDIGVRNELSGKPIIELSGRVAEVVKEKNVVQMDTSLTHTHEHAIAVVVLVSTDK